MEIVWALIVFVVSLVAWLGQVISWLAPGTAVRLSLAEDDGDVEPVYWADIRGEAMWDALTLWTLLLAGLLLALDNPNWAILGLIGGSMFLYFAGRGILTRFAMQRRGYRIGAQANIKLAYTFLAIWGGVALITMAAATASLRV